MIKESHKYIIVSGATASGKTSTSIEIAKYIRNKHKKKCEIINFDSLLFYKELNIGTAKPTEDEKEDINHHLIDISSIKNPINAGRIIPEIAPIKNMFLCCHIIILLDCKSLTFEKSF